MGKIGITLPRRRDDRGCGNVHGIALRRKPAAERSVVRCDRLRLGRPAGHPGQLCRRRAPDDAQGGCGNDAVPLTDRGAPDADTIGSGRLAGIAA